MGRVTPYIQDKLASSLVGTAGVDNSAGIMANATSQSASTLNSTALAYTRQRNIQSNSELANAFQGIGQEIQQRQAWVNHQASQLNKAANDIALQKHSMQLADVFDTYAHSVKDITAQAPHTAKPMWSENWEGQYKAYLEKNPEIAKNPQLRDGLAKFAYGQAAKYNAELNEFGFNQTKQNANTDADQIMAMLSAKGNKTGGSGTALSALYKEIDAQGPLMYMAKGLKTQPLLTKTKADATKNHFETLLGQDPNRALSFITSLQTAQRTEAGREDANPNIYLLSADEVNEYKSRAERGVNGLLQQAKDANAQENAVVYSQVQDIKNKIAGVHPDSKEADAGIKQLDDMYKAIKAKPITEENTKLADQILSAKTGIIGASRQAASEAKALAVQQKQADAQARSAAAQAEIARRTDLSDADKAVALGLKMNRMSMEARLKSPEAKAIRSNALASFGAIKDAVTRDDGTRKVVFTPQQLEKAYADLAKAEGSMSDSENQQMHDYLDNARRWAESPANGKQGLKTQLMGFFGAAVEKPAKATYEVRQAVTDEQKAQVDADYSYYVNHFSKLYMQQSGKNTIPPAVMKRLQDIANAKTGRASKLLGGE